MKNIWQKKINYNTQLNKTDLIKETDWLSPLNVDQILFDANIEETKFDYPVDSGNLTQTQTYYDINDETDYKPKPIWNISGETMNILTPNIDPKNIIYTTPILKLSNFDVSEIGDNDRIVGIQLKINKGSEGIHDYDFSDHPNDEIFFNQGIRRYTYDELITISNDDNFLKSKNLAKPFTQENIQIIDNQPSIISGPLGVWDNNFDIYGNSNEDWMVEWDKEGLENMNVFIQANQKVFRGYYDNYNTEINSLFTRSQFINWYENNYINTNYGVRNMSYEVSLIDSVKIKIFYKPDYESYNLIDRHNLFEEHLLKTTDIYFNFNKCLNGICYQYINDLDNIYKLSKITGDGYTINNMYNEYNIIDDYLVNLHRVDIAIKENIDLSLNYFKLDNIELKPGHLILLMGQDDPQENDVYIVNDNYYLVNSNLLSDHDKSYRAKFYIKLGTYKEDQYFLEPQGNTFPISGQYKTFEEGHSWIIKNHLEYDIYNNNEFLFDVSGNTVSNPSKLLFTNYDVARTMAKSEWQNIEFEPSGDTIHINYIDNDYYLHYDGEVIYEDSGVTFSGLTTNDLIYSQNDHLYVYNQGGFNIGDNIIFCLKDGIFIDDDLIPGDSLLIYYTTVIDIEDDYLILKDIPKWIYNSIQDDYSYKIINLHFCEPENIHKYLNYSPFGDILEFVNIEDKIIVKPKNDGYFEYFDYSTITITDLGFDEMYFEPTNHYQKYELMPFLEMLSSGTTLPVNVYNEEYILSGEYNIEYLYDIGIGDSYYLDQFSYYKITPNDPTILNRFKEHTFIDIGILDKDGEGIPISPYELSGETTRTLIREVTDEYMIIERPKNDIFSSPVPSPDYDLINVSKLQDISDILRDIYLYDENNIYYKYSDNTYIEICSEYAQILKNNVFIRNITTGIFYHKDGKFNLDLFNFNDKNLTYNPIELIDVGINKITKLPIPINFDKKEEEDKYIYW